MISNRIHYVGVNDNTKNLFEGLWPLPYGVSYNSYIIEDEKIALIDTVESGNEEEYLSGIRKAIGDRPIDYLVINHMEPDHSSLITFIRKNYPEIIIVTNQKAVPMIKGYQDGYDGHIHIIKEGEELSLGNTTLKFFMAPMVHWPEVMVTYDSTDKVLFSADGFGKFGALDVEEEWACEARRYYIGIVGKYGAQVQALLKKAATLDIQMICPLHGPILKEDLGYYIGKYDIWSKYEPEDEGVFIAYASIHGNTAKAAKKLAEMLEEKGAKRVAIADLSRDDMAEAVEDAFRHSKLVVASSTYDGGLFPCMEDFLAHLKAKNYQKRTVAMMENGSWAPMAAKKMTAILETMKDITICEPIVTIKSTMTDENLKTMEDLAEKLV